MSRASRLARASIPTTTLLCLLVACNEGSMLTEIPEDTFWSVAEPAAVDMDPAKLAELEALADGRENLYAFLVIRRGKIVSETYRNGANERTLLHVRSVTKHVTGLLAGMAVGDGLIDSTGVRVHFSDGYGGQLLLVAPALDLIVVAGSVYRVEQRENQGSFAFIFDTLLPLVFESAGA